MRKSLYRQMLRKDFNRPDEPWDGKDYLTMLFSLALVCYFLYLIFQKP